MKKPELQDFGLDRSLFASLKDKEERFYEKIHERKSGENKWGIFWIAVFSWTLIGVHEFLIVLPIVLSLWFLVELMQGIFLDSNAKPDMPGNYVRFKEAMETYEDHFRDERRRETKREEEKKIRERRLRQKTYEYWTNLDPYEFEHEIAALFKKHGYGVKVTKGSGGNSGGPIVRPDGVVVGVTVSGMVGDVQNINFGIKGQSLVRFLDHFGIPFSSRTVFDEKKC